jgi:hypothetical protein
VSDKKSVVKSVFTGKLEEGQEVEGEKILELIFTKAYPVVLVHERARERLLGENGPLMREVILDSIKATLDKICLH